MAVYHILPIFARVTTKTNYMKFRKLRIIQAGVTTNFGTYEGKEFPLVITENAVQSVVTLGNLKLSTAGAPITGQICWTVI